MTPLIRRRPYLRTPTPQDVPADLLSRVLHHPQVRRVRVLADPHGRALALYVYPGTGMTVFRFALPQLLPTPRTVGSPDRCPAWVPEPERTRYLRSHSDLPGNTSYPTQWLCELLWGGRTPPKGA